MKDNVISRQAAIDGVKTLHDVAWKNWHEPTLSANAVLDMIRELPSAQAESDNDTEFWRNRAKEYEKMVSELITDMSRGVKFDSVEFTENGLVFKKQTKRMTNKEWIDFLCEQFRISRTSAKAMLHGMMSWKKEDNFKKTFNRRDNGKDL